MLKTFFGTLNSEDAAKFTDAINQVQADEKQLTYLMKNNIHVVKSTISSFNNSMNKVDENEKRLVQNMEAIRAAMDTISNSSDKLHAKTQLTSLLNSLESIITSVSFDIDDVNNAILFAKLNVLHPTVLSPSQLHSELDRHRNELPKHYELPVSLSLQNINEIIDVSQLVCYYHADKIVIVVKIPLVLPQTYDLFNVIPFPVPYDISKPDTFALIAPSNPYVAITADHMFYSLIDDLSRCKVISEKCYVCALTNVYSTIANPMCETILLTDIVSSIPDSCTIKIIRGSIDLFHKITHNRWIFVQSEPGKCHITCGNDLHDEMLVATGILSLPTHCKAFFRTLQLSSTDSYSINVTQSHTISNFSIVIDDCCNKNRISKAIVKIPSTKIDSVNNLESLIHASVHLDQLENEIDKIDSASHLQKYGVHYMSLSYLVSLLVLLYLLYKSRKLFVSQSCNKFLRLFNRKKTDNDLPLSSIQPKDVTSAASSDAEDDVRVQDQHQHPTPQKRNIIITRSLSSRICKIVP